jgi:dienelactone hydrolase
MKFNKSILCGCFAVCASLFFPAPAPAQTLGNLPPGAYLPGPYPVGQTTAIVQDPNRPGGTTAQTWTGLPYGITPYIGMKNGVPYGRQWIVDIFYPADWRAIRPSTPKANFFNIPAETWEQNGIQVGYDSVPVARDRAFPLVVFLNGLTDDDSENSSQGYHLASQGVVVAMIRFHAGDFDFINYNLSEYDLITSQGEATVISYRGLDAEQTIDLMLKKNCSGHDLFSGAIDPDKIALAGWSAGGTAALCVTMGLDTIHGNPAVIPQDRRVKAVVAEDPATWVLSYSQLQTLNIPTMFLGSTQNDGVESPRPFNANQAEEYKVRMLNTVHDSFGNDDCNLNGVLQSIGIDIPPADFDQCSTPGVNLPPVYTPVLYGYATAFLKRILDHDQTYSAYFDSSQVYPNENGLFYFIDQKGGDTPYNASTVIEDLAYGSDTFVLANENAFYTDGGFNFWVTQPPDCHH